MKLNDTELRGLLYRREIKQADLARLAGIARPTVWAVCNGRSCSPETAQKIADALGVPLEKLAKKGR